ncbi:type II CAAX prenyl endopeptidase Rce1 family protein [Winogradskyella litorisediminis]|uniref:Type II CAAX prenyl endopeptidase Rce1 family protein n=1 Tax=Winogradskyella litorisediminis TaxID=1156618 RepID=A0ABW3ND79_9FLAO
MINTLKFRALELFLLFVIVPISLVLDWPMEGKLTLGAFGFLYVILISVFAEHPKFVKPNRDKWLSFLKSTLVKFIIIALVLAVFVYLTTPEKLFYVIEKPKIWLFFLGVYTLFSVIPQEFLYRTFFFSRYQVFFKNKNLLILINAGLFSLGHLFFGNTLVMIITFIGGLLFAFTFYKTNSTVLVMVEHMIYGCWLYTVGMGEMLGFPT